MTVKGPTISCSLDGQSIFSVNDKAEAYQSGGIGLMINEGALSTSEIRINAA